YDVAGQAIAAGHTYCPHFLGGGVGLEASAHLLAAVGGAGLLEIDVNPNPLRDRLADSGQSLRAGCWHVGDAPGLGIEELPGDLAAFETLTISRSL
ncbi:MAG: enolase C-terminal domain-like protein, partial [Filomicrobium sp.]